MAKLSKWHCMHNTCRITLKLYLADTKRRNVYVSIQDISGMTHRIYMAYSSPLFNMLVLRQHFHFKGDFFIFGGGEGATFLEGSQAQQCSVAVATCCVTTAKAVNSMHLLYAAFWAPGWRVKIDGRGSRKTSDSSRILFYSTEISCLIPISLNKNK